MRLGKKIVLMMMLIVTTTVVAMVTYFGSAYLFSTGTLSKTFKTFEGEKTSEAVEKLEPFSVLLMGVDTGTAERSSTWEGNSDSMIVVTVNPDTQKITMTSLERDILVRLKGPESNPQNGQEAKLNAAYAAGGAQMAMMTIEEMLDIDIDYYMQINMQGLVDLVNAVGGITVTNSFDFPISIAQNEPNYTATVEPGTHLINGDQALVYARMRYDDPEGDYGRQKRQREVIQKVMQKVLKLGSSVTSYKKILKAVAGNMQTDIKINSATIPRLLRYTDAAKQIKEYQLRGEDANIGGGSYQIPTAKSLLTTQNTIKEMLGKKKKTLEEMTTNVITYETLYGVTADISYSSGEINTGYIGDTTVSNNFYPQPEPSYENQAPQTSPATNPAADTSGAEVTYKESLPNAEPTQ